MPTTTTIALMKINGRRLERCGVNNAYFDIVFGNKNNADTRVFVIIYETDLQQRQRQSKLNKITSAALVAVRKTFRTHIVANGNTVEVLPTQQWRHGSMPCSQVQYGAGSRLQYRAIVNYCPPASDALAQYIIHMCATNTLNKIMVG